MTRVRTGLSRRIGLVSVCADIGMAYAQQKCKKLKSETECTDHARRGVALAARGGRAEAGARSTDNLGPCTPVFSLNIAGIRAHGRLLRRQTPKPKLPRRRRHVRILALKLLLNLIFVFVFA